MKQWAEIRKRWWAFQLKRKMANPLPVLPWKGWNAARSIGIVFDAREEESLERLRLWLPRWKAQGKVVKLLGYIGQRRPKNSLFSGRQIFYTDDLDWNGAPSAGDALEFSQTEFDVVINLDPNPGSAIVYVLAHTKSAVRVGPTGAANFYTLMMPMGSAPWEVLLTEMESYLSKISPA